MYGMGGGSKVVPVVASAATTVVLPNTGSNNAVINLALAVGAGLLTWGVLYARSGR